MRYVLKGNGFFDGWWFYQLCAGCNSAISFPMGDAEEAKAVLLAPANVDCGFSIVENNELKDRIISSIKDFSGIL